VNDVRRNGVQHLFQIREAFSNTETLSDLPGHKRFGIANGNDFTVRDPMDRRDVLVRDLAAAYESHPQRARD
jgi:hypothetical protein